MLIARIIFSWLPNLPDGVRPIYEFTYSLTEPVFRLARPLIPPMRVGMMAIDLSALLVFLLLGLVRAIFC